MLSPSVELKAKKVDLRNKSVKYVDEHAANEVPVGIHVNGRHIVTLFSLPAKLKELGVGWLLGKAIARSFHEIVGVQIKENNVEIRCRDRVERALKTFENTRLMDSSCGSTLDDFLADRVPKPFVNSHYKVKAEKILKFVKTLDEKSTLFKLTGGTHSAAVFHREKLVAFAEDVSRHNAVDKVIGICAMKEIDFSRCVITSSGRQSANMVLRAAHVGIPIVASHAGPVYSGVDIAITTGVTLICFVRGYRMNIYSHPERIRLAFKDL